MNLNSDSGSGTFGALTVVINSLHDAAARLQSWRKSRKNRRSGESELQDSLEAGEDDLKSEYEKLMDKHGDDFVQGDEILRTSLFKIANDIQHTIIDVIAKAELVHGYGAPELNPSDLWHISEKIRRRAISCMGELVLRIQMSKANQSSYSNNSSGSRNSVSSPSMAPTPPVHATPFHTYDTSPDTRNNGFYPPPARYSTNPVPLYTQPEYHQPEYRQPEYRQPEYRQPEYRQPEYRQPEYRQPEYRQPEYEEPEDDETEYDDGHLAWRFASQSLPQRESPPPIQTNSQALPAALQVGFSSGRPLPPTSRPRPASVSMTGTGYLARMATPAPFSEPLVQRPFSSAPPTRPAVQERSSYGFSQETRDNPDGRRATVGYTKPPQFDASFTSRVWTPEPPQEKPWVPRGALYSPIGPPEDLLDVTPHGHFRMPTPVNHGGHDFPHHQR